MPEKRIYGVRTQYRLLNDFLCNIGHIKKAKKNQQISDSFMERIMLAVTQVNGCRMCSYHHAKEALESGMTEQEIAQILGGTLDGAPKEELVALIFAQHYAETIGNYDKEAWDKVVSTYGENTANSILAYIRVIMVGNAQGNIIGAIKSRFRGKRESNSTFLLEISVISSDVFIIPFLLIKAGIKKLSN